MLFRRASVLLLLSLVGSRLVAQAPQDTIVIAGKGHEDYQILGQTRRHFDDREVAQAALERRR